MTCQMTIIIVTHRLWDVRTSATIREIEMGGAVFDIELSKDCAILTITHTTGVTFMDSKT